MNDENLVKVQIKFEAILPNIYDVKETFDSLIADAIYSAGGGILEIKEYEELEDKYLICIEAYLPEDYDESIVIDLIYSSLFSANGHVYDVLDFAEID